MLIGISRIDECQYVSQHGEDGVLGQIVRLAGGTFQPCFVELGAHPAESNTLALRAAGWDGIMMDRQSGPGIVAAQITRENVNGLLLEHFGQRECGVFSIDLDGNDYWIVEAMTAIEPAVIVVEYNAAFDAHVKLATPYREPREWTGGWDYSASINAWASLLWRKWRAKLCYIESSATNAFFVREVVAEGRIDCSRTIEELLPVPTYNYGNPWDYEWVEVD